MDKSRRHPVAIAIGLIMAGLAALVVASWVLDEDLADVGPDPGWTQALTIAIAVGTVAIFALRHRPLPALAWCVAVAALAVTALDVIAFISQYHSGFPGSRTQLAAVGGLAVTVGALVISRVPAGRWRRPSVASGLFTLGALLLVPVVAWPLLAVTPDWRLTASTAPAAEPAAVPATVSKLAWSTEVDGEIEDAVAAGMGAVVMFSDGVAGVDGTTGEIRWSRRRASAEAEQIDVSPDGRTVMFQVSPADRFPIRREVLDAFTGELRFAVDLLDGSRSRGFYTPMTNASYIGADEKKTVFHGFSLTDGRKLWDFPMPAGCHVIGGNSDQFAQANGMLLPLACGEQEFRYVSVDGTTGGLRWQYVAKFFSDAGITRSPDHKLVDLSLQGAPQPYAVLDTETGAVLSTSDSLRPRNYGFGLVGKPGSQTLVDVRSGRVIVGAGAALNCVLDAGAGQLGGGVLCLDMTVKPFGNIMTTGKIEFATLRFGDPAPTRLSVQIGGPFVDSKRGGSREAFRVIPAPGAVFMYSEFEPAQGTRHRLVGLS